MKHLLHSVISIGIFLLVLASPQFAMADCSINQAGPVSRPVSCLVGVVTYWCTTAQECQIKQNPALNNPPVQGEIGTFSDFFRDVNDKLVMNGAISTPQNFISNLLNTILPYIFTIAGLGLLIMLITGGFQIMSSVSSPEGAESGKKRITSAFVGFFILFSAYWLIQALEIIFGFNLLG